MPKKRPERAKKAQIVPRGTFQALPLDELRLQFLQSDLSLPQFYQDVILVRWPQPGTRPTLEGFKAGAAGRWPAERKSIREAAMQASARKLAGYYEEFLDETKALLRSLNRQAAKTINDTIGPDPATGEKVILRPLPPYKILQLSASIADNVKTVRLITNQSTNNVGVKGKLEIEAEGDLNILLTKIVEAMEKKGEDTLGSLE